MRADEKLADYFDKLMLIAKNTSKNQLFDRSVLGLKNATFEHSHEEVLIFDFVLAGTFFWNSEPQNTYFSRKNDILKNEKNAREARVKRMV